MAYVQSSDGVQADPQLEGIFSAIGGVLKKTGGFVAKKVVPVALTFVPVVGGVASAAYSQIPGLQAPQPAAPSSWQRAAQAAVQRAREDTALRERVTQYLEPPPPPAPEPRKRLPAGVAGVGRDLIPIIMGGILLSRLVGK